MLMLFIVVASYAPDEVLIYNIISGKKDTGSSRAFDVGFFILFNIFSVLYNYSYNPVIMCLISTVGAVNCVIFTASFFRSSGTWNWLLGRVSGGAEERGDGGKGKTHLYDICDKDERGIVIQGGDALDIVKKRKASLGLEGDSKV
jgi:hypothetical protein